MAQVPEYTRQVQLRPTARTEVRVGTSADTFGGGVGSAVQGLGSSLGDVAAAMDARAKLEEDAQAREAFNAYRREHRELLRNPQDGLLNRTGGNAAGIQQTAEERLADIRNRYGEGLSPRALRRYGEFVDGMEDQAHNSILTHTSSEGRNYIVNQRQATAQGYLEDAALNWHDEETFNENVELALLEQRELAALQGWDSETLSNAQDTLRSSALRNRVVSAAAVDPLAAEELMERVRGELSAEDAYAIDSDLKGLVLEEKANRFTQNFIRTGAALPGDRSGVRMDAVDRADDDVAVEFSMGGNRPNRPNQEIVDVVTTAAEAAFGAGTRVVVTSGTEDDGHQHGSNRHMTGAAADVAIFRPDGTRVKATDPDAAEFARAAATAGALGLGFGEGYMGGQNFHVDMVMPGGGQAHTWGAQGAAMRSELTALMQRGAGAVLTNAGLQDTPVNRQMVTSLGADNAQRVLAAVQGDPSKMANTVLPPEAMAANARFAGMTIGEVYDSVATNIGDDAGTRAGGRYFDAAAAYDQALAIEDPELRAEVLRSVDNMAALQDRARSEARREAQEQAWTEYTTTGRTNFPPEMRNAMGQAGWTSFKSAVANDQQGSLQTDPDTWEMLTRMASADPRSFAELNLASHYGKLTEADRKQFILTQEAVRSDLAGQERSVEQGRVNMDFDSAYSVADAVYQAMVEPTTPQQMDAEQRVARLNYQRELTKLMQDFYDREQRQPNTVEIRGMASVLAMPVEFFKPGNLLTGGLDRVNEVGSGILAQAAQRPSNQQFRIAVDYDTIPLEDRTRIMAQLLQVSGGAIPTEDQITEAYEQQQLMSVGLPPVVEIGSVPEWLIEIEKSANSAVTDEEIIERYQMFLMSQ